MNSKDSSPFFSRNPAPETDHPLSIRGRFGRLSFIGWYAFLNVLSFFASIAFSLAVGIFNFSTMTLNNQSVDLLTGMVGLGYVALLVFYLYFYIVITARRLHDLDKSGWMMLLMLLPVINVFFILYLLLAPGTAGLNRYGAPRPAVFWEKLLAWLMIIIAVLSIFSAGSMVSYMIGSGELEPPQEMMQKGTAYF